MKISGYLSFATLTEKSLPFYIATIGNPKFQPPVHRPMGIEDYQLLYTVKGNGTCLINDKTFDVNQGDVIFLPPGAAHEYSVGESGEWETLYITFNGSGIRDFFELEPCVMTVNDEFDFKSGYKKLHKLKNNPNRFKETSVELYSFLLSFKEYAVPSAVLAGKGKNIMIKAMHCMSLCASGGGSIPSLKDMADEINVSEEHFCRVFKEYTGFRPFEYINMLRVQKAKELLKNTNMSIKDIAKDVGFEGHSYFSMIFKRYVNCTPGEYRKNLKVKYE